MKKFTRTYAIIHLDALHANIRQAKERVGDNVKIMAIVKADAYGHGAIEVAKAIKEEVYGFLCLDMCARQNMKKQSETALHLPCFRKKWQRKYQNVQCR